MIIRRNDEASKAREQVVEKQAGRKEGFGFCGFWPAGWSRGSEMKNGWMVSKIGRAHV